MRQNFIHEIHRHGVKWPVNVTDTFLGLTPHQHTTNYYIIVYHRYQVSETYVLYSAAYSTHKIPQVCTVWI